MISTLDTAGVSVRHGDSLGFSLIDEAHLSPDWARFVETHPHATIFHHPAWLAVMKDQYGFSIGALCLRDRRGEVVAGLPVCRVNSVLRRTRWISLPFSDECSPLVTDAAMEQPLMMGAVEAAAAAGANLEVRGGLAHSFGLNRVVSHWSHVTALDRSPDALFKRLNQTTRRRVRRAQESGLEHIIRQDPEAMQIFYDLHLKTRRRQGVPIQPRRYFDILHRRVIDAGLGYVSLVRDRSNWLSASVICSFNKTVLYKYGASDPQRSDQNANYLMLWESMLAGIRDGATRFDFGKTSMDNAGLRQFKSGWGSVETDLSYHYSTPTRQPGSEKSFAFRMLSGLIRRNPPVVCRIAGEAIYKHFAA